MKIILPAALLALCMAGTACTGTSTKVKDNEESLKSKIENCTNTDSLEVYISRAKSYADSLAKAGKSEEAAKYLDELTPVIEKQAPSLKDQWQAVKQTVSTVAENAADSVSAKATAAADSLKAKTEEAKTAVADKAAEAKESVVEKANEVSDKATEAVKNAADKTKDAAAEALNKLKK